VSRDLLNCGAINANSSKTVKATDFKFDVHVSMYSPDKNRYFLEKGHLQKFTWRRYVVSRAPSSYIKWRHLVNLLPLDNAVLKLKHYGLLTLILTCAASNDLNPVYSAVW